MSRHKFGGMVADWAFSFNSDGSVSQAGGAVLTFWDSLAGGTQYPAAPLPGSIDDGTGLLDGTGAPVSSVTCDGNGEIPDALQGPDGVYKMAADASGAGTGPRRWLYANDIGDDLTTVLADVAAIPALQAAPEYVYYDPVQAAYPARPATTSPVWWIGPVAPTIGGAGGASGADVWLNSTGVPAPSGVASVTAGDTSITVGGTPGSPALQTGTLDQIAALHPPAAAVPMNGQKITGGSPGVAGTDFATVGQLGGGSTSLSPTAVKTSAYTAAPQDLVVCDTTAGSFTVTLPAAPADQTRIAVKDVSGVAGNQVTVACSGSDVIDRAGLTSTTIPLVGQAKVYQYKTAAATWYAFSDNMPLSQLDLRYPKGITPAASANFKPANPAGTTSVTLVMMGLGSACAFTPAGSGKVRADVTCQVGVQTAATFILVSGRYGTGTAPANGAAVAGTRFGGSADAAIRPAAVTTATALGQFACTDIITGLTAGTAYWFDLAVATNAAADQGYVQNISVTIQELIS